MEQPQLTQLPPDPDKMNRRRAKWADLCIEKFKQETGADHQDALCDLLCDLMHWSDRNYEQPQQFDTELIRAAHHYAAETRPERTRKENKHAKP
jgi:hypothetical protein